MRLIFLSIFTCFFFFFSCGQTAFQTHILSSPDLSTSYITDGQPADLDNDGDIDIITLSSKIGWYENYDGQGSFCQYQSIAPLADNSNLFAISDVDQDGDLDIVYSKADVDGSTFFSIVWIENLDGQAAFGEEKHIQATANNIEQLTLADVDSDGDDDLIYWEEFSNTLFWIENANNNDEFGTIHSFEFTLDEYDNNTLSALDLDSDGDTDLLFTSEYDDLVYWFENLDGQGNFGTPITISNTIDRPTKFSASDSDGDEYIDIAVVSNNNSIYWFKNNGSSNTFEPEQLLIPLTAGGDINIKSGDIDNDGDIDILTTAEFADEVLWFANLDGLGNFGPQNLLNEDADGANHVYTADLDGDNDTDIISTSRLDGKVAWYKNINGNGSFSPEIFISSAPTRFTDITAYDIDSDGDQDVIFSAQTIGTIYWCENLDGLTKYSTLNIISDDIPYASAVQAGDLDGDGDGDVVVASEYDDSITWYENLDGAGTFGNAQTISTSADAALDVDIGDINGDGLLDVIFAARNDSKIYWSENNGNGSFSYQKTISTVASAVNSVLV